MDSATDRFLLTGKVALVTGGSRGLGREMVRAFAQAGADVVIASRDAAACARLAAEVEAMTGRSALAVGCHVGHWDELPGLLDAAYQRFGRLDVLVNNAGKSPLYPSLTDVDERMWDSVLAVNLKGPFRLTALAGQRMAERDGGSIINISSTAAAHPRPGLLPYAAAKAGLGALTAGFALAYGPRVRVNCIMAGPFLTDVSKSWDMEAFNRGAQQHALKRGGQPAEIIGAALYFASDAASYTSGAVLAVDGGIPR
jgi:NAD(P)-dependent dehydrogenase (short-subunit alcohol dehydrogenase family)